MRYLRTQVLNRRAPSDQRLTVDVTNAVVMKTTNNLKIPTGTTAEQPVQPVNGMIRYNTTTEEFEGRQAGAWRAFRFKERTEIKQQSLGAGDGSNIYFGPLSPAPTGTVQSGVVWNTTQMAKNMLVVVENVLQLAITNYSVVQDPLIPTALYKPKLSVAAVASNTLYFNSHVLGLGASSSSGTVTLTFSPLDQPPFSIGSSITVSGFMPAGYNGIYTVTNVTNSSVSYTSAGTGLMTVAGQIKSANAVYTSVDLTGAFVTTNAVGATIPLGTIVNSVVSDPNTDALISVVINNTVTLADTTEINLTEPTNTPTGYYLEFTSPVPYGKMVTVLHGFDK